MSSTSVHIASSSPGLRALMNSHARLSVRKGQSSRFPKEKGKKAFMAWVISGSTAKSASELTNAGAAQRSARTSSGAEYLSIPSRRKPRCAAAVEATRSVSRSVLSHWRSNGYLPNGTGGTMHIRRLLMPSFCTARCLIRGGIYNGRSQRYDWQNRKGGPVERDRIL